MCRSTLAKTLTSLKVVRREDDISIYARAPSFLHHQVRNFVGTLKLVGDDNQNGLVDAGEPVLASVAAPAFAQDDGSVSVALTQPIQIAPGAKLNLLVAVIARACLSTDKKPTHVFFRHRPFLFSRLDLLVS